MPRFVVFVAATAAALAGGELTARAQVCTQPSPGVARIEVATATTTIKVVAGVPKANTVNCGFTATSIEVVGRPVNDTIKLNYVPPSIPVSITMGGGVDSLFVYGSAGNDAITCSALGMDRDAYTAPLVDDLFFDTPPAKISVYGQGGADVIDCAASPVKTALFGGDGDDAITGSAFNDTVDAGPGADSVEGGAGNDAITGGLGDDWLSGDAGNDTFHATAIGATHDGIDVISGGAGTDVVSYAKRVAGIVAGAGGEDSIGNDIETIKGGKGPDLLDFAAYPTPHNLYGGPGNDVLRSGAGADKLFGEAGNDRLDGRGGKDVLDGGDGNDIFASSQDGQIESLKCGAGRDWYTAGAEDALVTCEHAVERHPRLAAGTNHTCAVLADGRVKCWGVNAQGQLGVGDTAPRGDGPGELGNALPAVDLGTTSGVPHTAVSIASGGLHSCALLDDGAVKCWGGNNLGQLGSGNWPNLGDNPGEMGDALVPVALGTGRTALAIAAFGYTTCALLDTGEVKCWGFGAFGQLGAGSTSSIGSNPGEMGDALPPIDLGTGRTALAIAGIGYHACAILDDGRVKCWGSGEAGALGNGSAGNVGDQPGEMGNALPAVDLGTDRIAVAIAHGSDVYNTCALLDDGTVKCWGSGFYGGLGYGDTSDRGDLPGEMGDALPAIDLGTGRTAIAISNAHGRTCAVLDDRSLKCWGRNVLGSLGLPLGGNRGDQPGEMGDALSALELGTGRTAAAVTVGGAWFTCAALDDKSVKCWGNNADGMLGLGDVANRGDNEGEMGDALAPVDLGGTLAFAPDAAAVDGDGDDRATAIDAPFAGDELDEDDAADPLDETSDGAAGDDAGGCSAGRSSPSGLVIALALALVVRRRRGHA